MTVTEKGTEHVASSMKALAAKEFAAAEKAGGKPSLATAKSCWENLKAKEGIDKETHPARYALVELQNLHDDGVVFEPIHRILEGAKADDIQETLEKAWGCKATPFVSPQLIHSVVIVRPEGKFTMVPPMDKLPIVSMTL